MKISIAEVVLDYTLYPRHDVDAQNVRRLRDAIKSGATLPPIVVCKKSKRCVDGFHRVTATKDELGETAEIEADLRTYKNDAALFADAWSMNAAHGRQLAAWDIARCITRATNLGLDPAEIKRIGSLTDETYDRIVKTKLAQAKQSRQQVQLKRTYAHLAGTAVSKKVMEYNDRAGGMSQSFYVNQVILMIDSGALDTENAGLMERLQVLATKLEAFLGVKA